MNHSIRFAMPLVFSAIMTAGATAAQAQQSYPQQGPPPQQQQGYPQQQQGYPQQGPPQGGNYGQPGGYGQGPQWDAPPQEFGTDISRRAFRDGIEAARADFHNHQPLDYRRSIAYRRPPAPRPARDEYRNAFSRGYDMSVRHHAREWGMQPPPPPPQNYPR